MSKSKLVVFFLCLISFFFFAEDVFTKEIMQIDISFYKFLSTYLINDSVTIFMKFITWFGSASCLVILTIISFLIIKNRKINILLFSNLCIITVLNQLLKFFFARPRPTDYRIINEVGYSFPSGHSMISMAFYGFIIYLIYKYIDNKYLKYILISFLSLLIILIGISRIYLGVHYTSDVLGGFLFSIAYLIIYIYLINKKVLK